MRLCNFVSEGRFLIWLARLKIVSSKWGKIWRIRALTQLKLHNLSAGFENPFSFWVCCWISIQFACPSWNSPKVCPFRDVLPDKSVHVLYAPLFSRAIWMCKVNRGAQFPCDDFMCSKLRPVVGGYDPYRHPAPFEWSLRRHEPVGRTAFPNRVFPWAWNIFPFPLRLQLPLAVLSYDHVHLPVTPHSLSVGMCGPVVNRNTVWDWYPCTRGGTSLRSPSVPEILADVILTDEFKDSTADVRGIWSGCRASRLYDTWLSTLPDGRHTLPVHWSCTFSPAKPCLHKHTYSLDDETKWAFLFGVR